jgi:hypothetical protein
MPGVIPAYRSGPVSYKAAVAIIGGQLVVPNETAGTFTDPTIKVAGALAKNVLGVAGIDAAPHADQTGNNPVIISQADEYTPVYYGDVDIPVTYTAACDFGVLLVAGAAGAVSPYVSGTTLYDQIVGRCTEPGGVPSAGVYRARIGL